MESTEISVVPSNEMEANYQPANPEIDEVHNEPEETGTEHVISSSDSLEERFRKLMDSHASVREEDKGHNPFIGQVPVFLRKKTELQTYFKPRIVSIGPVHHDEKELQKGQQYKQQLAKKFIERGPLSKEELYDNILKGLKSFKECYDQELLKKFHGNDLDLAWMFFVDGCALIQFVRSYWLWFPLYNLNIGVDQVNHMATDLILLHNQLPFGVLNCLIEPEEEHLRISIGEFAKEIMEMMHLEGWAKFPTSRTENHMLELIWMNVVHIQPVGKILEPNNSSSSRGDTPEQSSEEGGELNQNDRSDGKQSNEFRLSICRFIKISTINFKRWLKGVKADIVSSNKVDRALELIWRNFVKKETDSRPDNTKATPRQFRSVKDLQAAGIILEPDNSSSSLRDISFNRGFFFCKLKIPRFRVSEPGKFLVFNLIAFEMHPKFGTAQVVTSYISFLNSLIATKEDVAELRKAGILFNYLPNDEDILKTFQEITSSLKPYSDIFSNTKEELIEYFNDKKSMTTGKWLSEAMYVYFRSPWTTIAFVSATILLILTITQTVFSILAYAQRK